MNELEEKVKFKSITEPFIDTNKAELEPAPGGRVLRSPKDLSEKNKQKAGVLCMEYFKEEKVTVTEMWEKLPSKSVTTPLLVFFSRTFTPGIGVPFSSTTFPVIVD